MSSIIIHIVNECLYAHYSFRLQQCVNDKNSYIYKVYILIRGQKHNRYVACLEVRNAMEKTKNEAAIVNSSLGRVTGRYLSKVLMR